MRPEKIGYAAGVPKTRVNAPSHTPPTTTGTKMIAGTEGWILESRSRRRFWNRGGEALRRAVRSGAIGDPILPAAPLSANAGKPRRGRFLKKSGNARMGPSG